MTSAEAYLSLANLEGKAPPVSATIRMLKKGIWLYFILVIFEGALRKWVLPGLATPLLVVRDPIALWLIAVTWRRGLLPANLYLTIMVILGIVGTFTAVIFGHGNLLVALFGARILLHFPLIFVIGRIFARDDIVRTGKALLWLAILMTALIAVQFYSPQSAWVNRGIGGSLDGAGFAGALDYFRPPGTFAFTNGLTLFYGLVGPFVFYFWLSPTQISRPLLIAGSMALMAAIPLSIARSLFFQVGVTFVFAVLAILRRPKYLVQLLVAVVGITLALLIISNISVFRPAFEAFTSRFETAGDQEGGLQGTLGDRFLGSLLGSITESVDQPFFGYGLGMGTNVGSMLLNGGFTFLIAEGEWGRLIGELGLLMGMMVIFIRIMLALKLTIASYKKLVQGDLLPWLLLSVGILEIVQAQWGQPTSLGFSILAGGWMLASLRDLSANGAVPVSAQ